MLIYENVKVYSSSYWAICVGLDEERWRERWRYSRIEMNLGQRHLRFHLYSIEI